MEERRFRVGSLFEWTMAALAVGVVVWLVSVPVQRLMGPGVEAALVEPAAPPPNGVPLGATNVPVMYLLDGREIRHGELWAQVRQRLPDKAMSGPVVRAAGEFGERETRTYVVDGTKFYVVSERAEPGGPLRVTAIYVP